MATLSDTSGSVLASVHKELPAESPDTAKVAKVIKEHLNGLCCANHRSLPRAQWPIGRVVKAVASPDGCIRTAEAKIKDKVYLRPVARLVELP